MSTQTQTPPPTRDETATDEVLGLVGTVLKFVLVVALVLVLLPFLLPVAVVMFMGEQIGIKARFWRPSTTAIVVGWIGVPVVAGLVTYEVLWLIEWVKAHPDRNLWAHLTAALPLWPWLIVNFAAGALLVPLAVLWHRRRIAKRARARLIPDVELQSEIELARFRATDHRAAHKIGVYLNEQTGEVRKVRVGARYAPHTPRSGGQAFGIVARPTIRTGTEFWRDRRYVPGWMDGTHRWITLPGKAGAIRAIIIAESGTGKTMLINALIACAVEVGMKVVFLDAKGDPRDAQKLAGKLQENGYTAAVGPKWNMFAGSPVEVINKIMRQLPQTQGDGSYYRDEVLAVLQAVGSLTPIQSLDDLRARVRDPRPHAQTAFDAETVLRAINREGDTAGSRVLARIESVVRPLSPFLGADGWDYNNLPAQVTIVPLSPVDEAQIRLGDTILMDTRNHLAERMRTNDTSDLLVIVDEFPQLVTEGRDPADTAASLFEVTRSAGVGLLLAGQSPAAFSKDGQMLTRMLASGAALIAGRSKSPEDVVKLAGTIERMEASGDAAGLGMKSGRSQHSWTIPPGHVRLANMGQYWIIQGGGWAQFRVLPT